MSDRMKEERAGKTQRIKRVNRMVNGEREGKLPTKGSGRQSSKTHGE